VEGTPLFLLPILNIQISFPGNPAGTLTPSGTASITDDDGIPVLDHRHLALALRELEHLFHFAAVLGHVVIVVGRVSRPGFFGVRSTRLAVDDDLVHVSSSFELGIRIEKRQLTIVHSYISFGP